MKTWFEWFKYFFLVCLLIGWIEIGLTWIICHSVLTPDNFWVFMGIPISFNMCLSFVCLDATEAAKEKEISVEEQIGNTIVRLSDLKLELNQTLEHAQGQFREYVVSKQYPIDDRFEVWAEWCNKKNHCWIINEADVPFFGKIVRDDEVDLEFYRYEEYDWLFFLGLFDDTYEGAAMRERYTVTLDDVKELLIKHNFSGYRHDW